MRSLCLAVLACLSLTFPLSAVTCGDILGPGGTYTLTADLDCSSTEAIALVVKDGAVLDLGGYSVRIGTTGIPAIALDGSGATIRGGTVFSLDVGIFVGGSGGHLVQDLTIPGVLAEGLHVASSGNVVERVHIPGGAFVGFLILGSGNEIRENICDGHDLCLDVKGSQNRIRRNVGLNDYSGIFVYGNDNLIARNQMGAGGGVYRGYWVAGVGNTFLFNTATGVYDFDAEDTHGDCDHNRWIANQFETATPACILGRRLVSQAE